MKVTRTKDTLAFNSVQLLVDVNKNSKVKINKIYFEGNDNFSEGKLKKKLKSTKEHPRIGIFKTIFGQLFGLNKEKVKNIGN